MKRFAIGRNGIVANVIAAEDVSQINEPEADVFEDVAETINPGDAYDAKDVTFDRLDVATHKIIFQLVNDVRQLKGEPAINAIQYRTFVKGQIELRAAPAQTEASAKP